MSVNQLEQRGDDHPHILDLVLTNESFIENIAMLAPLGKSDHSVLSIECTLQTDVDQKVVKHNKGNYEGMRVMPYTKLSCTIYGFSRAIEKGIRCVAVNCC